MSFSAIPQRQNNQDIVADWFNSLQQAGAAVEATMGGGAAEVSAAIANNQSSPADVSGMVFNPALIGGVDITYKVYRKTTGAGATELAEFGKLMAVFSPVAGTWEMTQQMVGSAGITFTILASGQIQYTSTNITGTASVSTIKFKYGSISL